MTTMDLVNDLEDLLKSYEEALNSYDFGQVAPLIAEDAEFWFSEGIHTGLDAIRAGFEMTWKRIRQQEYHIKNVRWYAADADVAVCGYTYSWTGMIGPQRHSGSGRGTTVLARRDGRWRIVHERL